MQRGGGRHHQQQQRAPQNNRQASRPNPSGAPTFESLSEEAFQLSERAERKRDEQASNLLSQCAALYQQALALNPHHLDTRYNLYFFFFFSSFLSYHFLIVYLEHMHNIAEQ